jgi:RNA polymerase sigma factor (TIGR02999 family)
MTTRPSQEITRLLIAWSDGDEQALDQLTPLVYEELHRLARGYMRGERPDHILQTTALINEAFTRLVDWKHVRWKNRAHFFGVAAQMMRRILVDHARARDYWKRGGGGRPLSLDETAVVSPQRSPELVALDDALKSLEERDPRKSLVVELRFFGGLSVEETAEVIRASPRTVMRDWSLARAWLYRELSREGRV